MQKCKYALILVSKLTVEKVPSVDGECSKINDEMLFGNTKLSSAALQYFLMFCLIKQLIG